MNKYSLRCAVIAFLLTSLGSASAQWLPTNGPYGGPAGVIGSIDTAVLVSAGVGGHVYRSTNDGTSWTVIPSLVGTQVSDFATSGSTIFAGANPKWLLKSMDEGLSWTPTNFGSTTLWITTIAVSGNTIFVGADSALMRSTDNGNTWTWLRKNPSDNDNYYQDIVLSGNTVYLATSRISRSTDNGVNWTIDSSQDFTYPYSLLVDGDSLYCATYSSGIFRTKLNEDHWIQCSAGLPEHYRYYSHSLCKQGNYLFFALGDYGVYRSSDNGNHWASANNGLTDSSVYYLGANGNNLFATTHRGIFRSIDNGSSWSLLNSGIMENEVDALSSVGNDLFAGTWTSGVQRSSDEGKTWLPSGMNRERIVCFGADNDTLYAGPADGIFRTSDHGNSWKTLGLKSSFRAIIAKDHYVITGSDNFGGIHRSSDGGGTWESILSGIDSTVYCFASKGDALFAGTRRGVFVSLDDGRTWMNASTGLSKEIYALATSNDTLFAATATEGVFFTPDEGASWTSYGTTLANTNIRALQTDKYLLVGTFGGGVFLGASQQTPWVEFNGGLG
ncbi:MAG: hypothetical protein Q8919_04920, partial [Bacteroidota bacterium]|nr:hypothetical protein [Bacteroidota bacterium]